jgi:Ser/Thr protein kinase RdoA (MazF antagonist)
MTDTENPDGPDVVPRLAAAARLALPRFAIAAAAPVALIHHRENAVFRIDDPADGSQWAMRVHRDGYRTSEEIRSELGWMDALREAGVPTPRARLGIDGDPLQLVTPPGGGPALQVDVLAWVEGRSLAAGGEGGAAYAGRVGDGQCERNEEPAGSPGDEEHQGDAWLDMREVHRLVGRTSALIQQHGRAWTPPAGFTRPVWDVEALIGPHALWGDYADLVVLTADQLALMHRAAERVRRRLDAFGCAPDRFGLTHGDLMPDNILVAGGVPHVIDFDDAGYGWYLYDLATLLADKVADPAFAEVRDAWIEGYRIVAPLPDAHLEELDVLVMARLLLGLGWMHTRRETAMARDFTPLVVALACVQAEKLLGG